MLNNAKAVTAQIVCEDALQFLKQIPSESIQLVISSPPYNIGKPYEKRYELDEYLAWQASVLTECARVIKGDGSLCWQVGNYVHSGEIFPLDCLFYHIIKEGTGLKLRNRIIWTFEHGLHASKRFSGRYETVLWFTKQDEYLFNLDPVRVPQKYPGKTYYKGPKKGQPSGNPLGKNPGDLWELMQAEWEKGVWDIPNVKSNHPEKTIHPAQFPIELIERFVLALTNPGDTVLDPFAGTGSSLIAALLHGRNALGSDTYPQYIEVANQRINEAVNGTLKRRQLGTKKYEPSGREKTATIPSSWER